MIEASTPSLNPETKGSKSYSSDFYIFKIDWWDKTDGDLLYHAPKHADGVKLFISVSYLRLLESCLHNLMSIQSRSIKPKEIYPKFIPEYFINLHIIKMLTNSAYTYLLYYI